MSARPAAPPAGWQVRGSCVGEDPELFFSTDPADVARAQQVCLECPVIKQCAAAARRRDEKFGVWAGRLRDRLDTDTPSQPGTPPAQDPDQVSAAARPAAKTVGGARELPKPRSYQRVHLDEVRVLAAAGESIDAVAMRMRVTLQAVERACYRHDRSLLPLLRGNRTTIRNRTAGLHT